MGRKLLFRDEYTTSDTLDDQDRLPSAAITAQRILEIARREIARREVAGRVPVSGADVAHIVLGDPAAVIALLQAAGKDCSVHDRCTSLQAAVERLGVIEALNVCLGFRLLKRSAAGAIDHIRHWQHAVLRSAYAGAIARRLRRADWACIQTAAVLRNLGDMINGGGVTVLSTARSSDREMADWLEARAVSSVIADLVTTSHNRCAPMGDIDEAASCIILAESMADVWLCADWEATTAQTQALAQHMFGAIPDLCVWVFGVLGPQAVELESLLRIDYPSRRKMIELYKTARSLRLALDSADRAAATAIDRHCRRQDRP